MQTRRITFSLQGKHQDEIREALDLQSASQVLNMGKTLTSIRQVLNSFASKSQQYVSGTVLFVSDYPLTGKTCLASTIANDWLETANLKDWPEPVVIILAPENGTEWSIDRLNAAIQATIGPSGKRIGTLVIIDNLERCVDVAPDLDKLLPWLFNSAPSYNKLLLYTDGVICDKQAQNILLKHLQSLKDDSNSNRYYYQSLGYNYPEDLEMLQRLQSYQASDSYWTAIQQGNNPQMQGFKRGFAITRPGDATSYLIGLIRQALQSPELSDNELASSLARTKVFEQLETHTYAKSILRILLNIHTQYQLPIELGFSEELVGNLFTQLEQKGWMQYEQCLDSLRDCHLIYVESGFIKLSQYWLLATASGERSFKHIMPLFDNLLMDMRLRIGSFQAWTNMGMIDIARHRMTDAIEAFSKCLHTPLSAFTVEYLADYLIEREAIQAQAHASDHSTDSPSKELLISLLNRFMSLFAKTAHEPFLHQLVDVVTLKLYMRSWSQQDTFQMHKEQWLALAKHGKNIEQKLLALVLEQLLLTKSVSPNLTEIMTDAISTLNPKYSEAAEQITLCGIIRYIAYYRRVGRDVKVLVSSLFNTIFPEQQQYKFAGIMHSDLWKQSIGTTQQLLAKREICTNVEELPDWIEGIIEATTTIQHSNEEQFILLMTWCAEVMAYADLQEQDRKLLLTLVERHVDKPDRMLRLYLATFLYNLLTVKPAEHVLVSLLAFFVKEIEVLGMQCHFDIAFQYALAFYLVVLKGICCGDGNRAKDEKAVTAHKQSIDEVMALHHEEFYLISRLISVTYTDYKQIYEQESKNNIFISLPNNWREAIEDTYNISLTIYQENFYQIHNRIIMEYQAFRRAFDSTQEEHQPVAFIKGEIEPIAPVNKRVQESTKEQFSIDNALTNFLLQVAYDQPKFQNMIEITHKTKTYFIDKVTLDFVLDLSKSKKPEQRVERITQHLTLHPAASECWYLLALSVQDDLAAIDYCHKAIALTPSVAYTYLHIAKIYHKLEKLEREIEMLETAFAYNPKNSAIPLRLAQAYNGLQALEKDDLKASELRGKALAHYRLSTILRADSLDDIQAGIFKDQAALLHLEHDIEGAVECYWKALCINLFDIDILRTMLPLLKDLAQAGQLRYLDEHIEYGQLVSVLLGYLDSRATDTSKQSVLASMYFLAGEISQAWRVIGEYLGQSRNFHSVRDEKLDIASILSVSGYKAEAAFYHGLYYFTNDLYEEAAEKFQETLAVYPDDSEVRYYLARCYIDLAKVQSKLRLTEHGTVQQIENTLRATLEVFFQCGGRPNIHEILGETYFLHGASHPIFYTYAMKHYQAAYFAQPNVQQIIRIIQARFELLLQDFTKDGFEDTSSLIELFTNDILKKLNIESSKVVMDDKQLIEVCNTRGMLCTRICQAIRNQVEQDSPMTENLEQLFLEGEQTLQDALRRVAPDYTSAVYLGNLYWEWQSWPLFKDERQEAVQKAFEAWQLAQQLMEKTNLPRIQRTLREEIEISITGALKVLRLLEE